MQAQDKQELAAKALALTSQEWTVLGFGNDPDVEPTRNLDVLTERVTALLTVRLVAIQAEPGTFADLSTTTIARTVLSKKKAWPETVTPAVTAQLRDFCRRMLKGYQDVPYHNREHGFHVVLSVNKLMDMMLNHDASGTNKSSNNGNNQQQSLPPSYGLRHDPLALCCMIFSALIHDVEHQGIPNRQLALENDRLAVLYNDQSIAENWSLYVAFSELLQDEFQELRSVLFVSNEEYLRFRRMVINIVLGTDIASPERTQIGKSKWKEAFGDPFETVERKLRAEARRMSLTGMQIKPGTPRAHLRSSGAGALSELSASVEEPHRDPHQDDDSWSATPENSAHEETEVSGMSEGQHTNSSGVSQLGLSPGDSARFERRMSNQGSRMSSKYRQRLGILRTVDLSGETLETYSRRGSTCSSGHSVASAASEDGDLHSVHPELDEPDELRAAVVMETFMTAADVAHNLQSFEHMVKWSGRLYMELRKAFQKKRGFDPEPKWFENQIGFLESYLLPLAHRLEDMGVFSEKTGSSFARIVEDNRDQWLTEGMDETERVIRKGAEQYPVNEET